MKKVNLFLVISVALSLIVCLSGCGGIPTTPTIPSIEDDIVYRAFLVGVGDYLYFPDTCGNIDLQGLTYNVDRMRQILEHCKFGLSNTEFSTISYLKDGQATKSNILQGIASTFSGADSNDISYFYYAGHGYRYGNISYLWPVEVSCYSSLKTYISVDELEQTLSAIPGTKVVFLDSCYSGGFIGKGKEETKISKEELESFNEEIINVFSQAQSKGLLTTNSYKVLTACNYYQESWFIWPIVPGAFDPYGLFSLALCEGCGYDSYTHPYPADGNSNGKITLHEAYTYTYKQVNIEADYQNALHPDWNIDQDTQVYPLNSDFIIIEE